MSALSSDRPRAMKPQAWSWLIVESAMPLTSAARSRTQDSWAAVTRLVESNSSQEFQVLFSASHSSVDSVSLARRAFSRDERHAPPIELAPNGSKTSRSDTVPKLTGSSPSSLAEMPMMTCRMTRAVVSSVSGDSSIICRRSASTMRAVPSARST